MLAPKHAHHALLSQAIATALHPHVATYTLESLRSQVRHHVNSTRCHDATVARRLTVTAGCSLFTCRFDLSVACTGALTALPSPSSLTNFAMHPPAALSGQRLSAPPPPLTVLSCARADGPSAAPTLPLNNYESMQPALRQHSHFHSPMPSAENNSHAPPVYLVPVIPPPPTILSARRQAKVAAVKDDLLAIFLPRGT